MIIGRHPRKDRMGANALCRCFRQVADHDAVMVGARGLDHQLLKQRVLQICQLEELEIGRVVEDMLDDRQKTGGHQSCSPFLREG